MGVCRDRRRHGGTLDYPTFSSRARVTELDAVSGVKTPSYVAVSHWDRGRESGAAPAWVPAPRRPSRGGRGFWQTTGVVRAEMVTSATPNTIAIHGRSYVLAWVGASAGLPQFPPATRPERS